MKRWIGMGILILLLIIGISTCSSNSGKVDRLKDDLRDTNAELTQFREQSESELAKLQDDYKKLEQEYSVLQTTKEMVFGKEIRLFDIQWKKGYWGILEGKVQNISDKPMERVKIIVVEYSQDGSLRNFYSTSESDLFSQEVAEWSISGIFLENGRLYEKEIEEVLAIYAFGNRSG